MTFSQSILKEKLNLSIRIALLLLSILLLTTCGVRQSEFDALKSKNDSLVKVLTQGDTNVVIKNSLVNTLPSRYTGETYDLYISYPTDYRTSGKTYPVLVVLDAEVNFGAVNYICQRLIMDELIPELFIVGIAYQGDTDEDTYYSLRARDFTPTADRAQEERQKNRYRSGTGGAENFVKFLSLELFPHLARKYPISDDDRTLYGHSFGGLFGTHLLINHPTLFDNYLLLSPSLWWNQKAIMNKAEKNHSVSANQIKLYMGTGALENSMVDDHLAMVRILKRNDPDGLIVKSEILDHETHRSIFGRGFTNGLRFLYAKDGHN
jgi:predicted alpha/beta superfamily hydrolase